MKTIFATLLALFLLLGVPAFGAIVIVGLPADPGTGNQYPYGGLYNGEYQQVYTSSLFSGPITINNLEFYAVAWQRDHHDFIVNHLGGLEHDFPHVRRQHRRRQHDGV